MCVHPSCPNKSGNSLSCPLGLTTIIFGLSELYVKNSKINSLTNHIVHNKYKPKTRLPIFGVKKLISVIVDNTFHRTFLVIMQL